MPVGVTIDGWFWITRGRRGRRIIINTHTHIPTHVHTFIYILVHRCHSRLQTMDGLVILREKRTKKLSRNWKTSLRNKAEVWCCLRHLPLWYLWRLPPVPVCLHITFIWFWLGLEKCVYPPSVHVYTCTDVIQGSDGTQFWRVFLCMRCKDVRARTYTHKWRRLAMV